MSHKYRVSIGRESPRPASRRTTTQAEPRRRNRLRFRLPRATKQKKQLLHTFVCLQKYVAAGYPARGYCQWFGSQTLLNLRRVWPQTGWCIPLHEGVRPLPFFGVKKAAKHAVPHRQTGCALRRPRRRRIGGAKALPPHAAGVRKSAFPANISGGHAPGVGRPGSVDSA